MSYTPIITITGQIQDFLGNNAVNATVSVRLTNFGLDNPRVPGSCIISTPWVPVTLNGSGGFSFTPIGNDVIWPPNTYYLVTFAADNANTASVTIPYQFTGSGSSDLSTILPFNQTTAAPVVSNIVVKNPTALQIINGFGLSIPQIQDLTAPLLPHTAGGTDLGSAALPFADLYIGNAATNNIKITGTATAARTFTLPDANSNPVQPLSGATSHQWVAYIDSNGVLHTSQPAYSDLSGVPQLALTIASASHKWLASYNASTGLFTQTQPDYSDLTGTPQLAITFGAVSHQFLTSYNAVTGAFTAAQPAFSDISGAAGLAQGGTGVDLSASGGSGFVLKQNASHVISAAALVAGDIPSLDASKITTGTLSASRLPNPGLSTLGGILELAPISHQWVNEITSTGVPLTSQPTASDLSNGTTGSGAVVLATSPTLSAPTVDTINKVTITAPATGSTLTIVDGKTLKADNTLEFAGTDGTKLTFQATGTVVNRDSTDTLTHKTIDTAGTGNHVQLGGVDLPASIGTNGQVLTNSSGVLAFTTVSGGGGGTPGGATNSIQYNDGAAFAGSMCLTPAGTIAPNAAFKSSIKTFSATGNSDLYTCPANKRAIITEMTVFNGHASSSSTLVAMLKIGGVYYPASASTSVLAQSTGSRSVTYVLEAGEILAVNMTQQPFNVVVSIMEFDNTSNIKSAKLTTAGTLTSGDNTVYTVPNGKSALVLNNTLTMCSGTQGTFTAGNNSGGNITYKWNVVPSGGSVGTTNQMSASVAVSSGAASSQTLTGFTMGAGDFISVNLSGGGSDQIAFVTVVEI